MNGDPKIIQGKREGVTSFHWSWSADGKKGRCEPGPGAVLTVAEAPEFRGFWPVAGRKFLDDEIWWSYISYFTRNGLYWSYSSLLPTKERAMAAMERDYLEWKQWQDAP